MKLDTPSTRLALQGDLVLITLDGAEYLYTIVHYVDGKKHELQMVNRSDKGAEPIPMDQTILDNLVEVEQLATPARGLPKLRDRAKWELKL